MKRRIYLDKLTSEDFDQYYELVGNEKVMAMITERALDEEEALEKFEHFLRNGEIHLEYGTFKVFERHTGKLLGLAKRSPVLVVEYLNVDLAGRPIEYGITRFAGDKVELHVDGPGGQKVNKTSSAVVLRHIPTGIEVRAHSERSQSLNRFLARRLLAERVEAEQRGGLTTAEEERIARLRRQKQRRRRRSRKKAKAPVVTAAETPREDADEDTP